MTKAMVTGVKAVFLDRDGTINHDPGYIHDPNLLNLIPGAAEALALLKNAGYRLIVVSNQSGVGRGLIDPAMLPKIHDRLNELLREDGSEIDAFESCIHHPDDRCACRKPKPKLILDAAARFGVDLRASFMVGDKRSDLKAGRAAGCGGVALVRTGEGSRDEAELQSGEADFVGDDLLAVARWIQAQDT